MKFVWPESQKRVSLKCGNMASVPSSGGGSAMLAEAGGSVCGEEAELVAEGTSGCCAGAGKVQAAMTSNQKAPRATLKMNFIFIIKSWVSGELGSRLIITIRCDICHRDPCRRATCVLFRRLLSAFPASQGLTQIYHV